MRRSRYQVYKIVFIVSFLGLVYYNLLGWPSSELHSNNRRRGLSDVFTTNGAGDEDRRNLHDRHRVVDENPSKIDSQQQRQQQGVFIEMPKMDGNELDGQKVHEVFRKHQQQNDDFRNPNNPPLDFEDHNNNNVQMPEVQVNEPSLEVCVSSV